METCQNAISPIKMAVKIFSFHVLTSSWLKKSSAYGITHLRERKEDLNRLMVDFRGGPPGKSLDSALAVQEPN